MKPRRYKLLLDENFFTREHFPILNSRHDVKHVVQDLKQSGISDLAVYQLAEKHHRLIITFNRKDFEPLVSRGKETGVIAVSPNMTDDQINTKLTAFLSKHTPGELYGASHFLTV